MTTGIHHVTALTRRVQANVDFYAGFLGLRLVKQTAGLADTEQLHLFYGDALGAPGSLVSFLVWENGAQGRTGLGQVAEIALAVPRASIGTWLTRAMAAQVPVQGPGHEFGETVLRLKDPDGIIVKLVGADLPATAPLPDPDAPTRLRAVTLLTDRPEATKSFLAPFGYRFAEAEGAVRRLVSERDALDVRAVAGYVPGVAGTGTIDHVALRAPDADAVDAMHKAHDEGSETSAHDRRYFRSLYLREPGGVLVEYASDGPGMTVDEAADDLGKTLFIPQGDAARAEALRVSLPQFALPGEERMPMRDLHFIHRFHRPENPDGTTLVLLHGTGGDEADLMPLAAQIAPRATLLGVRGRSTEEGSPRWFRRLDAMRFDQADIRAESAAFAAFVAEAALAYGLDPARMVFMGYSNGANLLGAVLQLHPEVVRRAILLRGIQVLEDAPQADLTGAEVLLTSGARDPYGRAAPALIEALRGGGAELNAPTLATGHQLGQQDIVLARDWLASR